MSQFDEILNAVVDAVAKKVGPNAKAVIVKLAEKADLLEVVENQVNEAYNNRDLEQFKAGLERWMKAHEWALNEINERD